MARVPAYSTDAIADAAIALADEHGLDSVSMRKVAARLGAGAMSLYRYVDSKERLFELMADRMVGLQPWPELTGDWRADLRDHARARRALLLAHPWLLRLLSERIALGENMLRAFEHVMSIVDGLGLVIDDMWELVWQLDTWVNGYVRSELDAAEILRAAGGEQGLQERLASRYRPLVDSGEYPYFTRFLAEVRASRFDSDARFERSLDRIMAGFGATLPEPGS